MGVFLLTKHAVCDYFHLKLSTLCYNLSASQDTSNSLIMDVGKMIIANAVHFRGRNYFLDGFDTWMTQVYQFHGFGEENVNSYNLVYSSSVLGPGYMYMETIFSVKWASVHTYTILKIVQRLNALTTKSTIICEFCFHLTC